MLKFVQIFPTKELGLSDDIATGRTGQEGFEYFNHDIFKLLTNIRMNKRYPDYLLPIVQLDREKINLSYLINF